jgi:tetratricopeptide (TPR) repeat protein
MRTSILFLTFSLLAGAAPGAMSIDEQIGQYERAVRTDPASADKQYLLAASYLQKLRETADGSYLERAAKILDAVLARDGDNYEALRLRNEVALNLHQFDLVAEQSRRLAKMDPRDPRNWGALGDALMEMGDYDRAADAYQHMVDLRPGLSSYNRIAFYRFVTGDAEGAITAMMSAIGSGSRVPENLAWCLVDLGWMHFKTGHQDQAAAAFGNALEIFPGYHRAWAGMGQVLAAHDHLPQAIECYRKAQAVVPLPEYAAALAEFYAASGNQPEARKQRAMIDMLDQLGTARGEKTNRNLAIAYADQDRKLDRALDLAQAELSSRRDVYTYDALAWALYKNKRYAEAREAAEKAMRLNTPEPAFYYHAGMIAAAQGRESDAAKLFERAQALNPRFDLRWKLAASGSRPAAVNR